MKREDFCSRRKEIPLGVKTFQTFCFWVFRLSDGTFMEKKNNLNRWSSFDFEPYKGDGFFFWGGLPRVSYRNTSSDAALSNGKNM